jgi:hypothetical protein
MRRNQYQLSIWWWAVAVEVGEDTQLNIVVVEELADIELHPDILQAHQKQLQLL